MWGTFVLGDAHRRGWSRSGGAYVRGPQAAWKPRGPTPSRWVLSMSPGLARFPNIQRTQMAALRLGTMPLHDIASRCTRTGSTQYMGLGDRHPCTRPRCTTTRHTNQGKPLRRIGTMLGACRCDTRLRSKTRRRTNQDIRRVRSHQADRHPCTIPLPCKPTTRTTLGIPYSQGSC